MPTTNLVQTAANTKKFSKLLDAAKAAGVTSMLEGKGPYTLFAPNDDAFKKIPSQEMEALLADKRKLKNVVLYHVVPGKVLAADAQKMKEGSRVKTEEGHSVTIHHEGGKVVIDEAHVVQPDVMASNGVIHIIDRVMMPH